eukprot:7094096-Alexandrium_andersonii.AAC.1
MAARQRSGLWAGTKALLTVQAQRAGGRGATRTPSPAAAASSRSTSPGRPRTTGLPLNPGTTGPGGLKGSDAEHARPPRPRRRHTGGFPRVVRRCR